MMWHIRKLIFGMSDALSALRVREDGGAGDLFAPGRRRIQRALPWANSTFQAFRPDELKAFFIMIESTIWISASYDDCQIKSKLLQLRLR